MSRFSLVVGLLLALVVVLTTPIAGTAGIRDTSLSYRYADALAYVERMQFFPHDENWRWDPSADITRRDLIEILLRVQHEVWSSVPAKSRFANKPLEVAEAVKILSLGFGLPESDHEIWFVPYLEQLAERRALPPTLGRLHYPMTRAEVAEIIYRLDNQITFKESLDYLIGDEVTFVENLRPYAKENTAYRKVLKEKSCAQLDFTMGFIFVGYQDPQRNTLLKMFLDDLRNQFEQAFLYASYGLATMDVSDEVSYMDYDGNMVTPDLWTNAEFISEEFYKQHPDKYDFLTIVKNFKTKEAGDSHIVVANGVKGTGQSQFNSNRYGNTTKLKGINIIDLPQALSDGEQLMRETLNLLLHETNHTWCCFFDQDFQGNGRETIAISKTGHFYPGLHNPYIGGGPLRSQHWYPLGNGTYQVVKSTETLMKRFHPFTLYLMGLMPDNSFSMSFPVFSAGPDLNSLHEDAEYYAQYSVDDLIKLQGDWACENSS